jgi:hypothetical protein
MFVEELKEACRGDCRCLLMIALSLTVLALLSRFGAGCSTNNPSAG